MSALRGPGRIAGLWLLAAGFLGACTTPPPVPPAATPVVAAPQRLDAQTVRLYLPPSVRTVGQAAAWLLDGSGYDLVLYCAACPPRAAEIAAQQDAGAAAGSGRCRPGDHRRPAPARHV